MFGFIGRLFGTQKAIDNIVDKDNGLLVRTGGFFNDLHYSEAEEARDNKDQRNWAIRQLDAVEPFKVVQRIIVFAAVGLWLFVGLNVILSIWLGNPNIKADIINFALSDYVLYPAMSAFGLYLSGGVVSSFNREKK